MSAGAPFRALAPILSVAFVGSLGFSIVLPFLVFLVTDLGGNALVYGAIGATYSLFQFFGAPILGRWSDRYGRRRILLLSQAGTLLSWALFLVALFLPLSTMLDVDDPVLGSFTLTLPLLVLFVARALDGLTGGNVSVANAYLADVTDEEHRSSAFGQMAVASNLGFVLGPAIAGLIGGTALGAIPPVLAAIGISVIALAIIFFGLEESTRCSLRERPEQHSVGNALGQDHKECYEIDEVEGSTLSAALRTGGIRLLLSVHFLVFLAFNFFYIAFPVHAATALEWSLPEVGVFFSVMGLLMASVQGPVLAVMSARFSERTLVIGGSIVLAAGFYTFTSTTTAVVYGATALVALGNGLMWPSLLALISGTAGERDQGVIQGFASSAAAVASIAGLLVGGLLYESWGGTTFAVAAVITGAAMLGSLLIRKPPTEAVPA